MPATDDSEIKALFSGDWPDTDLKEALRNLYTERRTSENPMMNEDHIWIDTNDAKVLESPEAKKQISDFAQDIRLIGPGLYAERRGDRVVNFGRRKPWKPWGGAFARVLESKRDRHRRCIQYLYVYTRQSGAASFFWMCALPVLMFLWGGLLQTVFDGLLLLTVAGITVLPLLRMSVAIHWNEWKNPAGSRFILRSTTWSIAFAALFLVSLANFVELIILFWVGIAFLGVWIAEMALSHVLPQAHDMDYVPLFIWIRKTNGFWEVEKMCWDLYHYHSEPFINPDLTIPEEKAVRMERVGLQRRLGKDWRQMKTIYTVDPEQKPWVQTLRDTVQQRARPKEAERLDMLDLDAVEAPSKPLRFRLDIPDPWHAMELEKQAKENYLILGIVGVLISALLFAAFYLGTFSPLFGADPGFLVDLFFYTVPPAIFVQSGLGIVRARFNLLGPDEEHFELTDNKLRIMWNLEEDPRLKIVTKLQDPFNDAAFPQEGFSFNDDPYHLYSLVPKARKKRIFFPGEGPPE